MKKTVALMLAVIMLALSVTGCLGSPAAGSTGEAEKKDNVSQTEKGDKIVSEDGDVFIVDVSAKGEIKAGAESVGSRKVVICDVTYEMPVRVSELMANGWEISGGEFEDQFDPEQETNLVSFYMNDGNGNEIMLGSVYNDKSSSATLSECLLYGFTIDTDPGFEDSSVVFPGGITGNSTAADVLEVFGDPNDARDFDWGYNLDDQLSYVNDDKSEMTYHFTFNEDGSLYQISVEMGY